MCEWGGVGFGGAPVRCRASGPRTLRFDTSISERRECIQETHSTNVSTRAPVHLMNQSVFPPFILVGDAFAMKARKATAVNAEAPQNTALNRIRPSGHPLIHPSPHHSHDVLGRPSIESESGGTGGRDNAAARNFETWLYSREIWGGERGYGLLSKRV